MISISVPKNFLNEYVEVSVVSVQMGDLPPALVKLKPNDNLSKIRTELKNISNINMKSFAEKNVNSYTEIAQENESEFPLNEIIETTDEKRNILYLVRSSKLKFLNEKCSLEYGRTIAPYGIERAKKQAFIIKDCEMIEISDKGGRKGTIEFNSKEDLVMKSNLFFTSDINVENLVKLVILQNKDLNDETGSTCHYTEFGNVSLKFSEYLEPTPEFIEAVESAIKSRDSEEFKKITESYGQFIPTEVILGGRAYFKRVESSKGNKCIKLIGGQRPGSLEGFDERAWVNSLYDFRNWDCIEFKNPISIFQLLSNGLRKLILLSVGKKIHYSNIKDFSYTLNANGKPTFFELEIPPHISKIFQNKEADCNVFATVIDKDEVKKDFFSCQIYLEGGNPILLIHCIRKELRIRECKLKIGWMIIGYHTNFNSILIDSNVQLKVLKHDFNSSDNQIMYKDVSLDFKCDSLKVSYVGIPVLRKLDSSNDSLIIGHHFFNNQGLRLYTFSYCLKKNHYVNLPDFTFYTLIISKYPNSDDYGILSFNSGNVLKNFTTKVFKSTKSNYLELMKPKYISLYSTGESNCGPIFLKQKFEKIKKVYIESIDYNCKRDSCICKSNTLKKLKKDLKYAFFSPHEQFVSFFEISFVISDISTSNIIKNLSLTKPSQCPIESTTIHQQMIQRLKLNHGLFLNRDNIQPSKQAIFTEDGELNIIFYAGQPIVYTNIRSKDNFDNDLQQSDACINFPIAELIYKGDMLESFSKCTNNSEELVSYGHLFARKTLIGGKLFIKNFNLAPSAQIGIVKSHLTWAYNSAKYDTVNPFNNLSALDLLPKIETLDGEVLNNHEKLANWMSDLYQKNIFSIISYENLIPISQLKCDVIDEKHVIDEKQPGVANFERKLILEKWIEDGIYNLVRWVKDFHFLQGLVIDKYYKIETSKKIAFKFVKIPNVESVNNSYFEIFKPTTKTEEFLIFNNIFSIKDISSFPFVSRMINTDDLSYSFLFKCEQYKILLNDKIKPTKEFEQAIEEALDSMKPLNDLQNIFNEYGHLFPQRIILGRCLKSNLPDHSLSNTFDKVDLESPTFESLIPYLDKLNLSCLSTQKENTIEKDDLPNWFQNLNNDLEIVEFDNIIPLYKILKVKQQRRIDDILKSNSKIIMTGITDLDLDNDYVDHHKRIDIKPSLKSDDNYEVFGSIISKNNSKFEDFPVNFGLHDPNGFSVMIKTLRDTDIKECYLLWMIIGIPSELSVFSPKNRDLQFTYHKGSVTLDPDDIPDEFYYIKSPFPLSQGFIIFINLPTIYDPIKIKLVEWSPDYIKFQTFESTYNDSDSNSVNSVRIFDNESVYDNESTYSTRSRFSRFSVHSINFNICIFRSGDKTFKIDDDKEEKYSLDLIGYVLSEEKRNENLSKEITKAVVTLDD